jgi:hypothetical protein
MESDYQKRLTEIYNRYGVDTTQELYWLDAPDEAKQEVLAVQMETWANDPD